MASSAASYTAASESARIGLPPLGDVARDLRGADDATLGVAHRRNRQRHLDQPSVLAAADGFVMLDELAAGDGREDLLFFGMEVCRHQQGDRLADHLLGHVTVKPLGAAVPADNQAVEVFAEDRVAG
jgi:hypothetical protein